MNNVTTTLKQHGLSSTAARRTVFQALNNQEPLSMHQLIDRCPGIDRASVYRTVALFERLGIVERLQLGWKYKLELSDVFHEHHHHATCLRCGQSLVLAEDKALEQYLGRLTEEIDFKLEHHQLELQGVCQACRHV